MFVSVMWRRFAESPYPEDADSVWIDDPDYGDFNEELIPKSVGDNMKSLRRVLAKISGNVYKTMFDDHVTVIAT